MSTMSKLGYVDVSDNRLQGTVPANVVAWGVAPLYVPALLHLVPALLLRPPTHTRNEQHLYLRLHLPTYLASPSIAMKSMSQPPHLHVCLQPPILACTSVSA